MEKLKNLKKMEKAIFTSQMVASMRVSLKTAR